MAFLKLFHKIKNKFFHKQEDDKKTNEIFSSTLDPSKENDTDVEIKPTKKGFIKKELKEKRIENKILYYMNNYKLDDFINASVLHIDLSDNFIDSESICLYSKEYKVRKYGFLYSYDKEYFLVFLNGHKDKFFVSIDINTDKFYFYEKI